MFTLLKYVQEFLENVKTIKNVWEFRNCSQILKKVHKIFKNHGLKNVHQKQKKCSQILKCIPKFQKMFASSEKLFPSLKINMKFQKMLVK